MIIDFGKHRGKHISQVPEDYLIWLIKKAKADSEAAQKELDRRDMIASASETWTEKIIKAGYRELIKKHHPDAGGSDSDAQQINAAYEKLKSKR